MSHSPFLRLLVFIPILLTSQACSTPTASNCAPGDVPCGGRVSTNDDDPASLTLGVVSFRPDHLIATDMVNALTQLKPYNVSGSVIKIPKDGQEFIEQLETVLVNRGYDIQASDQRTGKDVLMASVISSSEEEGRYTYIVAIDRIALKRDYYIGADRVVAPLSSLYVRGVSPDLIQLNDGLFLE